MKYSTFNYLHNVKKAAPFETASLFLIPEKKSNWFYEKKHSAQQACGDQRGRNNIVIQKLGSARF